MKWTDVVQAVAGGGTLLATIFGFTYVVHQIKLLRRSLAGQANTGLSEQSLVIMTFIADHPGVYNYIYNGRALHPGDPLEVEVLCVCEMIANYCDLTVAVLPDLPLAVRSRWVRFITDTISCSPALREHLRQHRSWYSDELLALT